MAMGACSAAGRVGGLLAPVLIDYLAKSHPALPLQAFAVATCLSAVVGGAVIGESYGSADKRAARGYRWGRVFRKIVNSFPPIFS